VVFYNGIRQLKFFLIDGTTECLLRIGFCQVFLIELSSGQVIQNTMIVRFKPRIFSST
jgi:hypothetical protein